MKMQLKNIIQIPYVTKSDFPVYNTKGGVKSPISGGFRQNVHHQRLSHDLTSLPGFEETNKQGCSHFHITVAAPGVVPIHKPVSGTGRCIQ